MRIDGADEDQVSTGREMVKKCVVFEMFGKDVPLKRGS